MRKAVREDIKSGESVTFSYDPAQFQSWEGIVDENGVVSDDGNVYVILLSHCNKFQTAKAVPLPLSHLYVKQEA
jgi:hypothetical protein